MTPDEVKNLITQMLNERLSFTKHLLGDTPTDALHLVNKTYADSKVAKTQIDTDGTLAANSDTRVASQKATKTYADTKIPNNIGTLKGDMIAWTSPSTPGRVPVGTDGLILTADSTQSTGVNWKAAPPPKSTNATNSVSLANFTAVQTVSPGFKPLYISGIVVDTTNTIVSFFSAVPATNGVCMITNEVAPVIRYSNAAIGRALDAGPNYNLITVSNFTATSFDINFNQTGGLKYNCSVYSMITGY